MFWYIPIELLEERYTAQMYGWIIDDLEKLSIKYKVIDGKEVLPTSTELHQFLSWCPTIAFKSTQLIELAAAFHNHQVTDGDVFFVADIWFPGIEAIAYMATMLGIQVRIYGIQHAGVFDPLDLVRPLLPWGRYQEAAWYEMCAGIFLGSEFIKANIAIGLREIGADHLIEKLHVTGGVWNPDNLDCDDDDDDDDDRPIVIWPHRLSPERNVEEFYQIVRRVAPEHPDVRWVISTSRKGQCYEPEDSRVEFVVQSKSRYYGMLRKAVLMLSTSWSENFGYTVREAVALETPILVPDRGDYLETIVRQNRWREHENVYASIRDAVEKTIMAIEGTLPVPKLTEYGGFQKMLEIMGL